MKDGELGTSPELSEEMGDDGNGGAGMCISPVVEIGVA